MGLYINRIIAALLTIAEAAKKNSTEEVCEIYRRIYNKMGGM